MLELLWLVFMTVLAWVRPRQNLVLEDLLLRHQLGATCLLQEYMFVTDFGTKRSGSPATR